MKKNIFLICILNDCNPIVLLHSYLVILRTIADIIFTALANVPEATQHKLI